MCVCVLCAANVSFVFWGVRRRDVAYVRSADLEQCAYKEKSDYSNFEEKKYNRNYRHDAFSYINILA